MCILHDSGMDKFDTLQLFSEKGDGGSMEQKVVVAFVPMLFVLLMLAYCLCIHKRHQDGWTL